MDGYTIVANGMTPEIYITLRQEVDFYPYLFDDVAHALNHTDYSVVIYEKDEVVGMGRLICDQRIVFFIKDVVVVKKKQSNGVGKMIMDNLLSYIDKHACEHAYVGLMATPGSEPFYERLGFIKRPTENLGHGMVMFYERKK